MSAIHVADTGLFVAMGQPSNQRYRAVWRFVLRNGMTFVLPQQVYDELTVEDASVETPPIDEAIGEGWVEVADSLEYENPFVSRAMDGVRRFIANADDRAEDEIERADLALAGVVAQTFEDGVAERAYVYTTDIAAGQGIDTVFEHEGYGDSVTFVNAFRFIEDLLDSRGP